MPAYTFTFANTSDGEQEWNVQANILDDTLPANEDAVAQVNVNEDVEIGVAINTVATPARFAAGNLRYVAVGNNWTFTSDTPNEFVFNYDAHNRTCRLSCSLEVEQ